MYGCGMLVMCPALFAFFHNIATTTEKERKGRKRKERTRDVEMNCMRQPHRQQWIIELVYSLKISPFPILPIAYAFSLLSLSLSLCLSPIKHRNIVTFVWWYFCNEFLSGIYRCAIASMCFMIFIRWQQRQPVFVHLNDVQLSLYKHREHRNNLKLTHSLCDFCVCVWNLIYSKTKFFLMTTAKIIHIFNNLFLVLVVISSHPNCPLC